MWSKKKPKPLSDRYTNNREISLKGTVSRPEAQNKPVGGKNRSKRLNPVGRKGEFWQFVNKVLDLFFERLEINHCEVPYMHNCWSEVHYSHADKRTEIPVGEWKKAFKVIKACDIEHNAYEAEGRDSNRRHVEWGIETRNEYLGLSTREVNLILLACVIEAQEKLPQYQKFEFEDIEASLNES